jgi:hypothetical protein
MEGVFCSAQSTISKVGSQEKNLASHPRMERKPPVATTAGLPGRMSKRSNAIGAYKNILTPVRCCLKKISMPQSTVELGCVCAMRCTYGSNGADKSRSTQHRPSPVEQNPAMGKTPGSNLGQRFRTSTRSVKLTDHWPEDRGCSYPDKKKKGE